MHMYDMDIACIHMCIQKHIESHPHSYYINTCRNHDGFWGWNHIFGTTGHRSVYDATITTMGTTEGNVFVYGLIVIVLQRDKSICHIYIYLYIYLYI